MPSSRSNLRGILAMMSATGFFVINDTFMKLVTEDLPPFQTLFMRGIFASLACLAIIVLFRQGGSLGQSLDPRVLARGFTEVGSVLCYIVALAHMPIADVIAIGQTAPLMLLLAAAIVFGDSIKGLRLGLIALGFVGALMVAQPNAAGLSIHALLAFGSAALVAVRDLIGRGIAASTPGFVVALATATLVMLGAGAFSFSFEIWVPPTSGHWLNIFFAGVLVALGHVCIILSYRLGETAAVAPFYYSFMIWAVIAGFLVWHQAPNLLGFAGMLLILLSGLTVILMDQRKNIFRFVD